MKSLLKQTVKNLTPWLDQDKKIYKLYLKSNKWLKHNNRYIAYYYNYKIQKKYFCTISPKAEIGKNLVLPHPMGVIIGLDVKIGNNCIIYQHVTLGQKDNKYPIIGDNVTIYAGAKVIGDVNIGNNVVIGANAVVLQDVPDNCIAVGIPARIILRGNKNE